jgi:hypothetical protein
MCALSGRRGMLARRSRVAPQAGEYSWNPFGGPLSHPDRGVRRTTYAVPISPMSVHPMAVWMRWQDAVLLNAVLLKLADVFQSSNNLSRYCIVQLLQKCAPYLQQVCDAPS